MAYFSPLFCFRQQIAFFGGGESALRAQRQLIQRHIFAGFFDAGFGLFFVFQFRRFRSNQPQDDAAVTFELRKRFEPA